MISFLQGKVISKTPSEICILCGGVGYQVFVSPKTSTKLKLDQKEAGLHIYTHVREDTISLFGFLDSKDKHTFTLLLGVSGVGPKIALAIESVATATKIQQAVMDADVDFFNQIPGIGKKSAQRIIVDLKPKLGTLKELDLSEKDAKTYADVGSALRSLGFSAKESTEAIDKVKNKDKLGEEEITRQALKNLGNQ